MMVHCMQGKFHTGTFVSLKIRDFRYVWLGVLFMMAGMNMSGIARGYLAYDLTSSPIILGVVSSGFAVPMLLFALYGGALADRLKKKRIMQICQTAGGITALTIAISISTGTVTWIHLFVASIIHGFIFAFLVPARTALIPGVVSQEHIANAFALNAAAMSSMTLLAPAIAGNLYGLIGAGGVYYTVSAFYFASVIFTGFIRGGDKTNRGEKKAVLREIGAALRYIGQNRLIIVLLFIGLSTALLSFPFRSLLPIYVVDVFDQGPKTLGLLVSFLGIGALIGSLGVATLGRRRRGLVLILGGISAGLAMIAASFISIFAVVAVGILVMGLGDAIRRSLTMALIMEQTDPELQGRVSSFYTMNFGLMPLGTLPASALAQAFSVQVATGIFGVLLAGVCITVALTQRNLRSLN